MMKRIFFTFIVIFLFSCNKTTGPVLPDVTTTEAALKNLRISIISSDSLIIRNGDSLLVNAMDVVKISVFEDRWYQRLEDSLVFLKTITPSYKNVGSLLGLEFSIPIKVKYPDYDKSFVLQFNMSDDTIIEVKTYVTMYKYPYENVERWFRFTDIGTIDPYGNGEGYFCTPLYTSDFEINDGNFYFNVSDCEAWGISKYNFITGESEYVSNIIWEDSESSEGVGRGPLHKPNYASGIHLAVDGEYLFCDSNYGGGGAGIYKINLLTGATESFLSVPSLTEGIEATNDSLFYIKNLDLNHTIFDLMIYNYSGTLLNTIRLPNVQTDEWGDQYYNLESYKGILYIWNKDKILRLNLGSLTFLTPLVAPLGWNEGFDIHDDILYFGYDDIYWLDLSELQEVE